MKILFIANKNIRYNKTPFNKYCTNSLIFKDVNNYECNTNFHILNKTINDRNKNKILN